MRNKTFHDNCELCFDKALNKYDNVIAIGDLNFNILKSACSQPLLNICDLFDLQNVVTKPTCFPRNSAPSLLDVILTNKRKLISNICNFSCGLSDVHNIIGFFS